MQLFQAWQASLSASRRASAARSAECRIVLPKRYSRDLVDMAQSKRDRMATANRQSLGVRNAAILLRVVGVARARRLHARWPVMCGGARAERRPGTLRRAHVGALLGPNGPIGREA